ncbi:MAG: hydrogenase expression/formation protein HypE [Geminocystis sp.]|nr:hydrogenase expression/formation protein HypE [Geminocystis sp.]HIK38328.1 hydrogenase expression/formation protein HypE [Geminocystis sp. M7585_C2015_104]MCS7148767.1 hydrogenase expression/formation protein HypE [Geminocystis sp.]MCX8078359.1 hydrogenase expression/formation protein HypE [Geminocystis sp.]MDW8116084.1 hydrogenase expression/formation protein HypE [Geminocystis sp.]
MEREKNFILNCPLPIDKYTHVLMAHGGGGKLMHQLIEQLFLASFPPPNSVTHDSVTLNFNGKKMAFTTDSYVVNPLFFPGGDIGLMAVYGTVNDLAMVGAKPLYLSLGLIIEEGLSIDTLWKIVKSIKQAAEICQVSIVTGDTKVVEKGKGDGIFINTSGVGIIEHNLEINPLAIQEEDVIILSGDIGRHGIAIMAVREALEFETSIESDCAPLHYTVLELIKEGIEIHCLRDLTRGGLASALNEIAIAGKWEMTIEEDSIIVTEEVKGACEILGFDALYVANEGRFVVFTPEKFAEKTLSILQKENPHARIIGRVKKAHRGVVVLNTVMGSKRVIDMLSGEQLPRIC